MAEHWARFWKEELRHGQVVLCAHRWINPRMARLRHRGGPLVSWATLFRACLVTVAGALPRRDPLGEMYGALPAACRALCRYLAGRTDLGHRGRKTLLLARHFALQSGGWRYLQRRLPRTRGGRHSRLCWTGCRDAGCACFETVRWALAPPHFSSASRFAQTWTEKQSVGVAMK